jgi:hypothetical protein
MSPRSGYDLKRIMRTGTVATVDNRNWELRDQAGPVQRLSQSRAIALDMESATIAANGFRFRVPYGTLLCVSDKPLHGELKLPGMASSFYKTQVSRHCRSESAPWKSSATCRWSVFTAGNCGLSRKRRSCNPQNRQKNVPTPCFSADGSREALCDPTIFGYFPANGPKGSGSIRRRTDMAQKPMTKTQLVAALADEMGSDKKTARRSARRRHGHRQQGSRRRRRRHDPRHRQGLLPRAPRAHGPQPGHGRADQERGGQAGQGDHRQGAEGQRQRLIAVPDNRERVAPGQRARPFLVSGQDGSFARYFWGLSSPSSGPRPSPRPGSSWRPRRR